MPLAHVGRLLAALALVLDAGFLALVTWMALLGPIGFADELPPVDPNASRMVVALGLVAIAALLVIGVAVWRYDKLHRGWQRLTIVLLGCLALAHASAGIIVIAIDYPVRNTLIAIVQALLLGGAVLLFWRANKEDIPPESKQRPVEHLRCREPRNP